MRKVRVIKNAPPNKVIASSIYHLIGKEFEVIKTDEKNGVWINYNNQDLLLYFGEFEDVFEEQTNIKVEEKVEESKKPMLLFTKKFTDKEKLVTALIDSGYIVGATLDGNTWKIEVYSKK